MSRPSPSVPSGKRHDAARSQTGGARTARGTARSANAARRLRRTAPRARSSASTTRPIIAPRFSRNAAAKAASGEAARGRPRLPRGRTSATSAGMADPRIDRAIDEVDEQIDEDDHRRDQHQAALQRRIVAPADRLDQPVADARPGEDRSPSARRRPSVAEIDRPITVTTGSSALRSACTPTTRNGDSPLARAVRT